MSVLVTGGAGYIGSVAAERLVAAGEHVVVLDSLSTGHRAAVDSEAEFVQGDIRDTALVAQALADHEIETVMHFASHIQVGESYQDPLKYFENNVIGAHSVLKAAIDLDVPRFILSSTAAVYGNPESVPITEDAPTRPVNPYGLSKRVIEEMIEWYDRAYGLRYVALRYFNACGATVAHGEAHDPESHLIPNVLMAAEGTREHVVVYGSDYDTPDGTCVRDYIHVEDLVDAHLKAMAYLRNGGPSEAINLGNALGFSVLEVIEAVRRVTKKEFAVVYGARRLGDAARLIAASDKARRLLGWQPRKGDIDTIVRDAWRWRQAHPNGYQD